ncbi:MAG: carboxymuconolactone decarboxylase family protein [Longimicrobiales bacterium]|jgi:4-carboxymuconolactone decarboxylase
MIPSLTSDQAATVRLSAAVASRNEGSIREAMGVAKSVAPAVIEEVLLQSYLFLGYPLALNAIALWRSVSGAPAPKQAATDQDVWAERGHDVCSTVYGGQYEGLKNNVRALHPDLERWMIEEGYGKVLGRPGFSLVDRELNIVALLVVLGVPRQLYSHLRGALNAGAAPALVSEALDLSANCASDENRRIALETWEAVRARTRGN